MSNAPCLYKSPDGIRCYVNVFKNGYCEEHQPPKWQNPYYNRPKNWASLVRFVMARDKGVCYICKGEGADTVDHIIPKSKGGTDMTQNLAAVHDRTPPHCHQKKTLKEAQEGKWGNKPLPYGKGKRY